MTGPGLSPDVTIPVPTWQNTTALVLSGGRATRMGGVDKGLISYCGKPLIMHSVVRVQTRGICCLISANRNQSDYVALTGCDVVEDVSSDYPGPLAGILSAFHAMTTQWLWVMPCDAPLWPEDLPERLMAGFDGESPLIMARDEHYPQPLFALLHRSLCEDLETFVAAGQRKVQLWYARHPSVSVPFLDLDAFTNINDPDTLARLESEHCA